MSFDDFVIRLEGVSKRFDLYERPRDQLKQFILPRFRRAMRLPERQYFRESWALRDVSFEVRKGESWGVVGLNGSGKSTLLQIITGTLSPTEGYVATHGRIAALLELGSGFNPQFTGRENVYMNAALLGLSRRQVSERLSEIQEFADIGSYFDQPLSTYSSGMQMRVAFAVATAFEPDILIVDEALAVGDAYFQQKCFRRLESFKRGGGTLLFVSHDSNTVKHLCDRALLLSDGCLISTGAPRDVVDRYQGLVAQKSDLGEREILVEPSTSRASDNTWRKASMITTNEDAELVDFRFSDRDGHELAVLESEKPLEVTYVVRMRKTLDRPAFGLIIRDRIGRSIFETSTYAMRIPEYPITEGSHVKVRFRFESFNLRAGDYSFSVGVANRGFARSEFEEYSLLMHDVEQLKILDAPAAPYYGGVFNMNPVVRLNLLEDVNV